MKIVKISVLVAFISVSSLTAAATAFAEGGHGGVMGSGGDGLELKSAPFSDRDIPIAGLAVEKSQLRYLNVRGSNLVGCNAEITGFEQDGSSKTMQRQIPSVESNNMVFSLSDEDLPATTYVRYIICCADQSASFVKSAVLKDGSTISGGAPKLVDRCAIANFTLL